MGYWIDVDPVEELAIKLQAEHRSSCNNPKHDKNWFELSAGARKRYRKKARQQLAVNSAS